MFCKKCGSPVPEGTGFCSNCGASMNEPPQTAPPYIPPPAPQPAPGRKSTGGSSFFTSPAGIVLTVLIGILVLGGTVTGIIFAVKGCSSSSYEEELSRAWDEYESVIDEADEIETIDLTSARLESDLKKSRSELKKTQKKAEALEDLVKKLKAPDDKWRKKNDQFAGSVKYYNRYLAKLNELYATMAAATLDTQVAKLENILNDMLEAAAKARELADDFLDDNNVVTGADFDPMIFDVPADIADQAEGIITGDITVPDDGTSDEADTGTTTDTESARIVMDEVLALYLQGGWDAITGYMTPELYQAYISAPVPWGQVSYVVSSANVTSQSTVDGNTIAFGVVEEQDDFGEIYSATYEWQLVRSGNTWRVHNVIDEYGGSLL
ncbi:MAG: hypothetical protein JXA49_02325 [Actinobacteria bacterium]|nr:hypothetical protein [Actinomycetota bacterium]